ncbi:F-box only protein 9 [Sergentomyia squamirostris]
MDGTSGITAGDEESDEESSSSSLTDKVTSNEMLLEEFRTEWQKELQQTEELSTALGKVHLTGKNDEKIAEKIFLQGTEYERMGKVFDAIRHYRRAMQLVPDIENRVRPLLAQQEEERATEEDLTEIEPHPEELPESDDEDLTNVNLLVRFQNSLSRSGKVCERVADERVLQTSVHISNLPPEIILCIFKWVISRDLDMRSLDQLSRVCKGFYICARDSELWRQACSRIWGVSVGSPTALGFLTWRQMFQERYRLNYHGCYISKTSYLRYGENSFQDQFYRPVHLVEYYRYMRFFPEGRVLMLTTSEEPIHCVGKLKNRMPGKKEILVGEYELHGEMVIIMLKRPEHHRSKLTTPKRHNNYFVEKESETFYLEMKILTTAKRRFSQLEWKQYSVIQLKNKVEITTDFDLLPSQYPPLWFSRVKSYHAESESSLQ